MKRKSLFAALLCLAVFSVPCGQIRAFGADAVVKTDYLHFTDSLMKRFGMGSGWAGGWGGVSSRSFDFLLVDRGPANYFSFSPDVAADGISRDLGNVNLTWQIFGESNCKLNNWFLGVDPMSQGSRDFSLSGVDTQESAYKFRAGALIGFSF